MPVPHRLRKHADYQHAYAASRKRSSRQLTYFFAPRPAGRRSETAGPRVGLTVPKAIGKAHDRNRIKRRMRAVIQTHIGLLPPAIDVILHPRRSVLTLEFARLDREIADVFRSIANAPEPHLAPTSHLSSRGELKKTASSSRPPKLRRAASPVQESGRTPSTPAS